ncbi:unnamed protein product [Urochloa humidicola]
MAMRYKVCEFPYLGSWLKPLNTSIEKKVILRKAIKDNLVCRPQSTREWVGLKICKAGMTKLPSLQLSNRCVVFPQHG